MNVLWFAFGVYIIGVAVILFLRPSLMFHTSSGTWKEFGLGRSTENYTVFPFWMFIFVWAVMSYAIASFISIFFSTIAARQPSVSLNANNLVKPISSAPATTPGYYILESTQMPKANPRYVYYGTNPPTIENVGNF